MTVVVARRLCTALAASVLAFNAPLARAQSHDIAAFGQIADGDSRTRSVTLGATWSLRTREAAKASPWDVYLEGSIGRWFVHDDANTRKQFTQFGLTPVVRYAFGPEQTGVFVEVGAGVNWITPVFHSGDRRFSTVFNFGDHLGVGYRFGGEGANELALRVQHFSNGGLRNPNPGEDFVQLRYARHF